MSIAILMNFKEKEKYRRRVKRRVVAIVPHPDLSRGERGIVWVVDHNSPYPLLT